MKKGFTLIETIVVIAVIGLTLPVLIGTIFILIRQQTKVIRLSQVKREGDYIINLMENTIRNRAISIHSGVPTEGNIVCDGVINTFSDLPLYFLDKNGYWFGYLFNNNSIASDSADPPLPTPTMQPINLTSTKTRIENFSISCARNTAYSPASISLSFDVCYDTGSGVCTSTRPEETALLHYQTKIKLRNY